MVITTPLIDCAAHFVPGGIAVLGYKVMQAKVQYFSTIFLNFNGFSSNSNRRIEIGFVTSTYYYKWEMYISDDI